MILPSEVRKRRDWVEEVINYSMLSEDEERDKEERIHEKKLEQI